MIQITTRKINDVTVVDILGNLDTRTSGTAIEEINRIIEGKENVLINLEQVKFLGSAGIRILIRTSKKIKESGGTIKICNATGHAKDVMEISALDVILDLHDSESKALADF